MSDEELFGISVCAELDAFADDAPDLDEQQASILAGLLRTENVPVAA